ncbi:MULTISPECIES: tripartite tricarboxylate transporter permease [unclassified Pseudonocardia]|uniref:tripartite tricarboxylate transporter permease n=1 Tax=unclassified Pseudonocardia TaxID=2619320 RepID=UPI0001FFEBBE|nr:tripartite tricarboxylate transporter permease [Pseudonocardia sp. Ae707_Ps1]OLM19940.1 Tricarboxylate transport membrane protein TctA [Pseudonocardia sp. Ae707_Ps1]
MDVLNPLGGGLVAVLSDPATLLWCALGVTIGTLVGALPGIGTVTAMAVLLPLTFGMSPVSALVLLVAIYMGGMFGGRISSILLNIPGDASSVVSTFDGYPLARQGRVGYALTLSAVGSFVGGLMGFAGLALLAAVLAQVAVLFGPAEYLVLVLLVLVLTSSISTASRPKAIMAVGLGVLLSAVGLDRMTGDERFTWGVIDLWDGVDLVVVAIGLFGLSEVFMRLTAGAPVSDVQKVPLRSLFPPASSVLRYTPSMGRGGLVGFGVGIFPGAGASMATFIAYALEKAIGKDRASFGKGNPRGLAAPEAADNASVGGALIPTLSLGIPGSASGALILGGMIMVGLQPGPELFTRSGPVVWAVIAAVLVANVMLLVLNTALVPFFATALRVITPFLTAFIASLCVVGVYSLRGNAVDVVLMVGFGILGYLARRAGFPLTNLLLGLILGAMLEDNLRRALLVSRGDLAVFWSSPMAATLLGVTAVALVALVAQPVWRRYRAAPATEEAHR